MRAVPLTDWTRADDVKVKACLKVACGLGVCEAPPQVHCSFQGKPLPGGRIVHAFREDKVIGS